MRDAWTLISNERARQIHDEGWSANNDDEHADGELLRAGVIYMNHGTDHAAPMDGDIPLSWPWSAEWWKPKDRQANLVRAGALMMAERERIIRADGHYAYVGHVDQKLNLVIQHLHDLT